jgi:phenylpropionate dioxygenase-like ring-hydroxylating dioxygenase large terminal subunit
MGQYATQFVARRRAAESPAEGIAMLPGNNIATLVEPDRVRREVYTDADLFELEMQRIHERVWIYCGHESQIPHTGDYYAVQLGRQPMIMVRGADKRVHVLYNRCPHRGNMICGDRCGNTGEFFRCSYHAWTFNHDGTLKSIPMMESGYAGTRWGRDNPDCHVKRAARVESYRGFVFASLAADGPGLLEFLGASKIAFDDMCDRSPEGEVEIVPNCFRVIQRSNWKLFLENQLDALHPSVTHQSTGRAAREIEQEIEQKSGKAPLSYHMLSAFATVTIDKWDNFQTLNYPNGHCILTGYMGLRPQDPDTLEYERLLAKAYGEARKEEILGTNIHHVLLYPGLSVQSPLQQLRAVRPLSVERTLTEIWHFRLKGAPEPIYRRALAYYNLVNSPATLINADDLENFWKCHQGLTSDGGDWVSFHRHYGRDVDKGDWVESAPSMGTSEAPMRNQMRAWVELMSLER